jgi:hypothetical protein
MASGLMIMRLLEEPEVLLGYETLYVWDEVYEQLDWWVDRYASHGVDGVHPLRVLMDGGVVRPTPMPREANATAEEIYAFVTLQAIETSVGVPIPADYYGDVSGVLFELNKAHQAGYAPLVLPGLREWTAFLALANRQELTERILEDAIQDKRHREGDIRLRSRDHERMSHSELADELEAVARQMAKRPLGQPVIELDEALSFLLPDFHIAGFNMGGSASLTADDVLRYRESYGQCLAEMRAVAHEVLRVSPTGSPLELELNSDRLFRARRTMIEEALLATYPWARGAHHVLSSPLFGAFIDIATLAGGLASGVPVALPGSGIASYGIAQTIKKRTLRRARSGSRLTSINHGWYLEWLGLEEDLDNLRRPRQAD